MLRLLSIFGLAQICFVFLGNALKSVVTSTVFTSEGDFASFLNISVNKTGILVELLIGSAVLALAVTPIILTPKRVRAITAWTALMSVVSFGLLGAVMVINPALFVRELAIIATFSIGGFCIAFFAPMAQQAIGREPDASTRVMLTTIWTSAQPIAFLITPQLVKYVAHDIGTGTYFLLFSLLPLVFMALSRFVMKPPTDAEISAAGSQGISRPTVILILGFLLAFEALTASVSFTGLLSAYTIGLAVLFAVIAVLAAIRLRGAVRGSGVSLPPVAVLLLASLFILEFPSTGFYDGAYLIRHLCSSNLIADRASLGAAAQIATVFLTGMIFARWQRSLPFLLIGGIGFLLIGTAGYTYYPDLLIDATFFYTSKILASAGMGMVTTVIISVVMAQAGGNPVMVLMPAFVIMFGTEFGLELLEILFEAVKLAGYDELAAYRAVFDVQVILVLLAIPPALWALWLDHKSRQPDVAEARQG